MRCAREIHVLRVCVLFNTVPCVSAANPICNTYTIAHSSTCMCIYIFYTHIRGKSSLTIKVLSSYINSTIIVVNHAVATVQMLHDP